MMHYYQFNIGDYIKHTARLSLLEDLAYRRILDLYYLNDGAVISDISRLSRQIGMPDNKEEVEFVLGEFFELRSDKYHNSRADREISEYAAKAVRARVNGRSGGRPKSEGKPKNNPVGFESVPKDNPEETGSKANHKPLTINQELYINTQSSGDDGSKVSKNKKTDFAAVVDAYNMICGARLPLVEVISDKRKRAISKLLRELKEPTVECASNYFEAVMSAMRPFHFGENDRGWKADFDYITRVDTLIKVKENTL